MEGAGFLARLIGTTKVPVPDVEGALLALGERWGLSLRTRQMIRICLLAMPASHQESLWGLVNAVTQAAQTLPPDDRYDLEALAGGLAEHGLPKATPVSRRLSAPEGEDPLDGRRRIMTITKHGRRLWRVLDDDGSLVCVTAYRKGAREVVRRLTAARQEATETIKKEKTTAKKGER